MQVLNAGQSIGDVQEQIKCIVDDIMTFKKSTVNS